MSSNIEQEVFQYNDREVNWLSFNERVLQEAEDHRNPLYERIRFLAIFSSNLDEFFRVRISKIRQIKKLKKSIRKPLRLRPNKLLKTLFPIIHEQQERLGKVFREQLIPELARWGVQLVEIGEYSEEEKEELQRYFRVSIKPEIEILQGDRIHPDTFTEGGLYVLASTENYGDIAFVSVPSSSLGRFVAMSSAPGSFRYTYLEDIIKLNIAEIFPERAILKIHNIKLSKDAELYLDGDLGDDRIAQIYDSLKKRQKGQPTRLLYEKGMDAVLLKKLRERLGLGKADLVEGGERHSFSDFFSFPKPVEDPQLEFVPMPPLKHPAFEQKESVFDVLKGSDQLLHFPYQDFGYLEQWLIEAANDDKVAAIHISLYRIAEESKLTSALLDALDRHKEVHILVEAKARFDEKNNILWGRKFQEKGARVYYSFPNVKVHSKILLIHRKESTGLTGYAYIGTGNFNPKTSKIYVDHALLTSNQKITDDLQQVFGVLKRQLLLPKLKTLLIAPYNLRSSFEQMIQGEMHLAQKGLPAMITAKMNSLEDRKMIDWLYRANNAGVKIKLLVRGFCCLVPGVPGQSEHIEVISIVDRFLEHGRVFLFHNNGDEKMYMGSSDWMTRNLDRRIEVVTPVLDQKIFEEMKTVMAYQFSDNQKARRIDSLNMNTYIQMDEAEATIRSQYYIYEYLKEAKGLPNVE